MTRQATIRVPITAKTNLKVDNLDDHDNLIVRQSGRTLLSLQCPNGKWGLKYEGSVLVICLDLPA